MEKYQNLQKKLSTPNTGHSTIASFNVIQDICLKTKPKNILEIGFNRGDASLMFLLNSEASITSIDVREESEIKNSINIIKENFEDRFTYLKKNAYSELPYLSEFIGKFDLIYIDCWHTPEGYEMDTNTAMLFGSKYIVFDDYITHKNSNFIKNYVKNNNNLKEIILYNIECGKALIENINYEKTKGSYEILENIKNIYNNNLGKFKQLFKCYNL